MTRVLFLDVDGVLNSAAFYDGGHPWAGPSGWSVDPAAVARLLRLLGATGADVVLSSGWRNFPEHLPTLAAAGLTWIGATPLADGRGESPRWRYIQEWLDAHPEVASFAIVDDDPDAGERHPERFVLTEWATGLRDAHVDALAAILA